MAGSDRTGFRRGRSVVGALAAALLAFVALTVWSVDQNADGDLVNAFRRANRLSVVRGDALAMKKAQAWSNRMAATGRLEHTGGGSRLDTRGVTGWCSYYENVGYGPTVQDVHKRFQSSRTHRANMLSRTHRIGVGVARKGNMVWVTEIYLRNC